MMATSKTKTTAKAKTPSKAKKSAAPAGAAKTRSVRTPKKAITEDDIRAKAQEIYNDRIARGVHATADEDWLKAESQLRGKKR